MSFQIKGVAGIALGDLYYTPYHLEIMDLSIPYTAQCLTFLTPESLTDNSWQTLILPFRYVKVKVTLAHALLSLGIDNLRHNSNNQRFFIFQC